VDRDRYLAARLAWRADLTWESMPGEAWVPGTPDGAVVEVGKRPLFEDWPREPEAISPWTVGSEQDLMVWEVVAVRAYWKHTPDESLLWHWNDGVALVTEEAPGGPAAATVERLRPLRPLLSEPSRGGRTPGKRKITGDDIQRVVTELREDGTLLTDQNVAARLSVRLPHLGGVSPDTVFRQRAARDLDSFLPEFLRQSAAR
jgi:hypothetical protein